MEGSLDGSLRKFTAGIFLRSDKVRRRGPLHLSTSRTSWIAAAMGGLGSTSIAPAPFLPRQANVYLIMPLQHVAIFGCTNCTIVLGTVSKMVTIEHCEKVRTVCNSALPSHNQHPPKVTLRVLFGEFGLQFCPNSLMAHVLNHFPQIRKKNSQISQLSWWWLCGAGNMWPSIFCCKSGTSRFTMDNEQMNKQELKRNLACASADPGGVCHSVAPD